MPQDALSALLCGACLPSLEPALEKRRRVGPDALPKDRSFTGKKEGAGIQVYQFSIALLFPLHLEKPMETTAIQ